MAMRELDQIINSQLTDKNTRHSYINTYKKLFNPIRSSSQNILEIGIAGGGGALMFRDFFDNATVYCVDIVDRSDARSVLMNQERIVPFFNQNAYDLSFINENFNNKKFDIIVDDGPHTEESQLFFLDHFSDLINPSGILIVEDVNGIDLAHRLINNTTSKLNLEIIDLRHERVIKNHDNILIIGRPN